MLRHTALPRGSLIVHQVMVVDDEREVLDTLERYIEVKPVCAFPCVAKALKAAKRRCAFLPRDRDP